MNPVSISLVVVGVFSMAGAICNWEWFMNARKARFMVTILTRNGARVFYGLLGLALLIFGALGVMGIIDMSK